MARAEKVYGWYSREADELFGRAVYKRKSDGNRVLVTLVTDHKNEDTMRKTYLWKDTVFMGELINSCLESNIDVIYTETD